MDYLLMENPGSRSSVDHFYDNINELIEAYYEASSWYAKPRIFCMREVSIEELETEEDN